MSWAMGKLLVVLAGIILCLFPGVLAQGPTYIEDYQVTASYSPETGEELIIYFNLVNNHGNLKGLVLTFNAESAEYIHEVRMGGKEAEEFSVDITSMDGKTVAEVLFPQVMEIGAEKEVELKFKTTGLVTKAGDTYTMRLKFDFTSGIDEKGERITIPAKPGVIKVHVPPGYLHTSYEPTPWREIWQGVSGFDSHFVIVYDTVPLTQETQVTFKESETVAKAARIDKRLRDAENQVGEQQVAMAKTQLGKAIDLLISGTEEEADEELEKALVALTAPAASSGGETEPEGPQPKKGICGPIAMLIIGVIPKYRRRCRL